MALTSKLKLFIMIPVHISREWSAEHTRGIRTPGRFQAIQLRTPMATGDFRMGALQQSLFQETLLPLPMDMYFIGSRARPIGSSAVGVLPGRAKSQFSHF